ncbi:DUF6127 family protein [Glacieibacterium frigidum]|uniref:Uncharacterized protein n=1 Tax=Glacieibacterium frigidum TaxID=2593303 RepID=A0A552U835_9SPHN|nr:DUF6127 family protein [Glacieibacterium frigidum]TRW14371.1 hypothetical protein FMM06_11710 [Glacieibacterium frigidum]
MNVSKLLAAASAQGADAAQLIDLVEAASEAGATRALSRIGLHDEAAGKDIGDLRQLVQGWRDAKSSAARAVVTWAVRGMIALLILGLAIKLGMVR